MIAIEPSAAAEMPLTMRVMGMARLRSMKVVRTAALPK